MASNPLLDVLFQSTLPVGGATRLVGHGSGLCHDFNPRSPWGERHPVRPGRNQPGEYFNPRSPWGERRTDVFFIFQQVVISIHAPRGGSDLQKIRPEQGRFPDFNPRSPRGERPFLRMVIPMRNNFNPRSPRGERHFRKHHSPFPVPISIHAPRGGSDHQHQRLKWRQYQFQSTLPAGGATYDVLCFRHGRYISIHAPRGGSDLSKADTSSINFLFQSTLPAGGATFSTRCLRL